MPLRKTRAAVTAVCGSCRRTVGVVRDTYNRTEHRTAGTPLWPAPLKLAWHGARPGCPGSGTTVPETQVGPNPLVNATAPVRRKSTL